MFSCAQCAVCSCRDHGASKPYPDGCVTASLDREVIDSCVASYSDEDRRISLASAEIEGDHYGKVTRVDEVLLFARRMGYRKLGLASCLGLASECRTFARVAEAKGFEAIGAICKVGSIDKCDFGLPDEKKLAPGNFEAMCNPILQADVLRRAETELNIVIGLCVGHDTLFIKHSAAPVTYLIVKDRVTCHNPAGPLYTIASYSKRLLSHDLPKGRS